MRMKKLHTTLVIVATLLATYSAWAEYAPVSLGGAANNNLQAIDPTYPSGEVFFASIPFYIEPNGNNVVWNNDYPSGVVITDLSVDFFGITRVHTLLNTTFGQPGPASYLRLEFIGDAGAFYAKEMLGDIDVRDLNSNQNVWTTAINNSTTVNVFKTPRNEYYIDKQTIDLPVEFETQTLSHIRMVDSGRFDFQRAVLYGVTVQSVPEGDNVLPTGIMALGALACVRRWFGRLETTCSSKREANESD